MTPLAGKTAIVTGSTSGIGYAIACALAEAGADIMLNGFGEAGAIEKARAGLAERTGRRVGHHGADMAKPAEIRDLVASAERDLGGVDILVNNAGIQHTARVEDFPDDRWDAIIAINLSSAFHATKAAIAGMRARGWGRVINTASAHGLVASVEKAGYVAAKHGIVGLTKVVALENAGSGVTCNAICPGWVRTPLVEKQIEALADRDGTDIEAAARKLLGAKQPSAQFVTPEQLGQAAVFLCSAAADQMTGTTLTIDGGWTAQ